MTYTPQERSHRSHTQSGCRSHFLSADSAVRKRPDLSANHHALAELATVMANMVSSQSVADHHFIYPTVRAQQYIAAIVSKTKPARLITAGVSTDLELESMSGTFALGLATMATQNAHAKRQDLSLNHQILRKALHPDMIKDPS